MATRSTWMLMLLAASCTVGRAGFPEDEEEPPVILEESSVFGEVALPTGGDVGEIRISGGSTPTLYIRVRGDRMFRSEDEGSSWEECQRLDGGVDAISATDVPGTVYLGSEDEVYVSTDACRTWSISGLGQGAWELWALGAGDVLAATNDGIHRLTGSTWAQVPSPHDTANVRRFATDASGQFLFVGSSDNGLIRSQDGGQSWQTGFVGMTSTNIEDIAVDPTDASRIFVQTVGGLLRSVDGGDSYVAVLSNGRDNVVVDPGDPTFVIADGWDYPRRSISGGNTWASSDVRSAVMDKTAFNDLVFDRSGSGRLYVATDRGVFVAADHSLVWVGINSGLQAYTVGDITLGQDALHLATSAGLVRSYDDGDNWSIRGDFFTNVSYCVSVFIPAADPNVIWIGGNDAYLSTDRGTSFSTVFSSNAEHRWNVSVIAGDATTVFLGTGGELAFTTDGGGTWSSVPIAGAQRRSQDLFVDANGALYIATSSGFYVSTDGGQSSTPSIDGLGSLDVEAIDQLGDGTLVLGTADGFYTSADVTGPWMQRGLAGSHILDLLINGNTVIAAGEFGVSFSRDAGFTWEPLPGLSTKNPQALALDASGNLLVGTNGFGLHRVAFP